jgi:hypothetical protein
MRGWCAAAALIAAVTCGCAATSTVADPVQLGPSHGSRAGADPARLVGSWHLDATGEPDDAILTIGDRVDAGLLLFHSCGMLSGSWRANSYGMFVGSLDGGDGACFRRGTNSTGLLAPRWLTTAVSFTARAGDELLLDADGAVVATLHPGAHPTVGTNDSADYVKTPVVTAELRNGWHRPAPLPDGVRPVSSSELRHRWVPTTNGRSRAYVEFRDGGMYGGSDGCNGQGGRYVLGPDGIVLATSGPSTLIGCENNPLPAWVARSGRLGLRGAHLVFVDPKGKVLGEAARAS